MCGALSPKLTVPSMRAGHLSDVRRHNFTDRHIFCTQDMPEVPKPSDGCEACHIYVITQIDDIQTKWWARWERMVNLSILLIADCQHRHFHRYNAPFTVILQHLIADIL